MIKKIQLYLQLFSILIHLHLERLIKLGYGKEKTGKIFEIIRTCKD